METKANYIVIGLFACIVAVGAVLFGLWAAKFTVDTAWNDYRVLFRESVMGLSEGSAVLYNGVNVGRVTKLKLNPSDPREVFATIKVAAEVPIKEDTRATIRLTGLTGTAAVQLSGGSPGSPLLGSGGGEPPLIEAESSPLAKLLESSEGIVVTANRVMARLDELFTANNIERLNSTLAAVESAAVSLAAPEGDLNRMLASARQASATLPGLAERLDKAAAAVEHAAVGLDRELIGELPALRGRLGDTLANLESASGRVDRIIAGNEQALSRLGGEGMRELSGGIEDVRRLIRRLHQLVGRIEQNPSEFLLGRDRPQEYSAQ